MKKIFFPLPTWSEDSKNVQLSSSPIWSHLAHSPPGQYSKCDQASDFWQQLELAAELESDIQDTVDLGRKWLVDLNTGKTQLVLFDQSNNTGAIDVKMDWSFLEEKSSFEMLGLSFSSKLDWRCYFVSVAKTASKKTGDMIHFMQFLSPEVAFYLYKSTRQPCMK